MILRVKLCWSVYQIDFFTLELGLYLNVDIMYCVSFLSVIFNNEQLLRLYNVRGRGMNMGHWWIDIDG